LLPKPPEVVVKAPKTRKARKGKGFSVAELTSSGLSIPQARKLGLRVDERRSTKRPENIEVLQTFLKQTEQKTEKGKRAKRSLKPKKKETPKQETKE
jgi:large subunit ribosomal protein L13e